MPIRQSPEVRALETRQGTPIELLVVQALNEHQTHGAAAAALGVNRKTFSGWVSRLHLRRRTVFSPAPGLAARPRSPAST